MDESYITAILDAAPPGLTRAEFAALCKPDINAGYRAEVEEATRRYFGGN